MTLKPPWNFENLAHCSQFSLKSLRFHPWIMVRTTDQIWYIKRKRSIHLECHGKFGNRLAPLMGFSFCWCILPRTRTYNPPSKSGITCLLGGPLTAIMIQLPSPKSHCYWRWWRCWSHDEGGIMCRFGGIITSPTLLHMQIDTVQVHNWIKCSIRCFTWQGLYDRMAYTVCGGVWLSIGNVVIDEPVFISADNSRLSDFLYSRHIGSSSFIPTVKIPIAF